MGHGLGHGISSFTSTRCTLTSFPNDRGEMDHKVYFSGERCGRSRDGSCYAATPEEPKEDEAGLRMVCCSESFDGRI